MLKFWMTSRLLIPCVRLLLGLGRITIFPVLVTFTTLYHSFRKEYRLLMRNFLNNLENDKVTKLCNPAESDENLFWKLLKGPPNK